MGYRSDMYFLCLTSDVDKINKFLGEELNKIDNKEAYLFNAKETPLEQVGFEDTSDCHDLKDHTLFTIEWVKWYDMFPDVVAFHKTLSVLEDNHIPYEFLRLGESEDDSEWYRQWDEGLNVHLNLVRDVCIE